MRHHRRDVPAHVARGIHTRAGVAVLITGAVIYAAGSVLLAQPYVSRPTTPFIAVSVAAVAGMVVLAAPALVVAFLISALGDLLAPDVGARGRRKRARNGDSDPALPGSGTNRLIDARNAWICVSFS